MTADADVRDKIDGCISGQAEPKRSDMWALHELILATMPGCRLWFLDGTDSDGRTVSNPNIGYGLQTIRYADGKTREFYQIGMSANTTGISIYVLGLEDRSFLSRTYGPTIGKASVTGYCIRFKRLQDINVDVLRDAMRTAVSLTG